MLGNAPKTQKVLAGSVIFGGPRVIARTPEGWTCHQIANYLCQIAGVSLEDVISIEIDGQVILQAFWPAIRPKPHVQVYVVVRPSGGMFGGGRGDEGKSIFGMVAMIAIGALAVWAGPAAVGLVGLELASTSGALLSAAVSFGINAVGGLLLNALIPPPSPPSFKGLSGFDGKQNYQESPTYSLSGARNQARPFGPIPVILGRHKFVPPLAASPVTEIVGEDEYLRLVVCWGYGPLAISDLRIGDTPIGEYDDVEIETREGWEDDEPLTLYRRPVDQYQVGADIEQNVEIIRATSPNTDTIGIDITFPRGLITINNSNGSRGSYTVSFEISWRLTGSDDPWSAIKTINKTARSTRPQRLGAQYDVPSGQYDVRMIRTTPINDYSGGGTTYFSLSTWSALKSYRNIDLVKFKKPLALTAIRIKATGQINRIIDDLSGIVESYAPIWDGSTWGSNELTCNPAALARHVLTGTATPRPRAATQLDDNSFGEFYEYCEVKGYEFNHVRDFQASVWNTLRDILGAGRATPNIVNGRWAVLWDEQDKPVAQHFTPRNSWGFESQRTLTERVHAFRVRFNDASNGWQEDERIVYDDGYDSSNATLFERLDFPGVTYSNQNWELARYHIAAARLRPETYKFNVDWENLRCTRGDRIKAAHDAILWGLVQGRITGMVTDDSGNVLEIALDEQITMEPDASYGLRIRYSDGTDAAYTVVTVAGNPAVLEFTTPIPAAEAPEIGDLAMFGEAERETVDLVIKAILPGPNLSAKLVCLDYAPAIHDADSGTIPPWDPQTTKPLDPMLIRPAPPVILSIDFDSRNLDLTPDGDVLVPGLVSLAPGLTIGISLISWQVRYRKVGTTTWTVVESTPAGADPVRLYPLESGATYEVQARGASEYGVYGVWCDPLIQSVYRYETAPADVTGLSVQQAGGLAILSWDRHADVDVRQGGTFHIRHAGVTEAAIWAGSVSIGQAVSGDVTVAVLPLRPGTYLVKARDSTMHWSKTPAMAIATGAQAVAFTNLTSLYANPAFLGNHDGTVGTDNVLTLANATMVDDYPKVDDVLSWDWYGGVGKIGTYEFASGIDLGMIKRVRLRPDIESVVFNFTETWDERDGLIDDWLDVDGVAQGNEGDLWLEYRETDDDPTGSPVWSEWCRLDASEAEARAFQFRAQLISIDPAFSPRVETLGIIIDEV